MDQLDPQDAACLRMLAGAHFLGGEVTLPSGRKLSADEVQALTSAYAPAVGESEHNRTAAKRLDGLAQDVNAGTARMAGRMPRDGESLLGHYLANGGDPSGRAADIMREADRGRARRASRGGRNPDTHVDGVAWHEAPIPWRWHRCRPQTTGSTTGLALVERCACGAIRLDGGPWMERNSRRKAR